VWIPEEEREKSSTAQRGKGVVKQHMVRRTGKHSKNGRKRKGC